MEADEPKMLSIWTWVALILGVYGAILLATGLYRAVAGPPGTQVLAALHADIWWPAFMLVVALALFLAGRRAERE